MSGGALSFYYRDFKCGTSNVEIGRADLGIDTGSLTVEVKSYSTAFVSGAYSFSNMNSITLCVGAYNYAGETDTFFNDTVVLAKSSPKGRFSASATPWQDTTTVQFSSGILTFYYMDRKGGTPSVAVTHPDIVELYAVQKLNVTMPVLKITKGMLNIRTNVSDTGAVAVNQWDTIQYSLTLKNQGTETAINVMINDTMPFDPAVFSAIDFVSMETSASDSWAYALDAPSDWQAWGITPAEGDNVKGLKWFVNSLAPGAQRVFRFRVRVN
jgi:uncharacterized repeat protein (TIGR01451 family)